MQVADPELIDRLLDAAALVASGVAGAGLEEVLGSIDLYLTEEHGGGLDADDEKLIAAIAAVADAAVDNARRYAFTRRRQRLLEATSEINREMLRGTQFNDVLVMLVQHARDLADADVATVAVLGEDGQSVTIQAADGANTESIVGRRFPIEGTMPGQILTTGQPVVLDDITEFGGLAAMKSGELNMMRALGVPIGGADRVRASLGLGRAGSRPPFDPATVGVVTDLAEQVALAFELADQRRRTERLSVYADRERIARDLHDQVIQRLFATSMTLEGTKRITTENDVSHRLARAVEDLDDTMKVIRTTVFALSDRGDDPGLRAAVLEVCEKAASGLGFTPAIRFTGPSDHLVRGAVAEHLLAVIREGLANAARHAGASRVDVWVDVDVSTLRLRIADDGRGIGATTRRSGLRNLEDRAAQMGGSCRIGPGPESGTVLEWSIPLAR